MANKSILNAFDRLWQHTVDELAGKSSVEEVEVKLIENGQIGYIDKNKQVVFPQTTLNFEYLNDPFFGGIGVKFLDEPIPLVVGEEYTVVFDGTEYKCVSFGDFGACLGNNIIYNGTNDTGEPFYYFHFEGLDQVIYTKTPGNHTIEIYTEEDVIVPIDPKFLPDTVATDEEVTNALSGKADVEHSHSEYATKEELESVAENIVEEADLNAMLQEVLQ